jgi:hypothetical protein
VGIWGTIFEGCSIVSTERVGRRDGGICMVIGGGWEVVAQVQEKYYVGAVIKSEKGNVVILNVYVPPYSSPFAPIGVHGYVEVLQAAEEWVNQ